MPVSHLADPTDPVYTSLCSTGRDHTCHARKVDASTGASKLCGRAAASQGSLLCEDHECVSAGCARMRQETNPYCFVHK